MKRTIKVIIDLQFGSTGKGLIAGYLAKLARPDTVVTAWAANAGHTFVDDDGRTFIHTMLANGIVSPLLQRVMMGPGSVIDPDNLQREIESCLDILRPGPWQIPLYVHANAAVITQRHRDEEAGPMTKIGSTKKGCGAAAIQRIRRNPDDRNDAGHLLMNWYGPGEPHPVMKYLTILSPIRYAATLAMGQNILVEGAQGYSLSMYHGFYPYTTSRDVSTAQVLADCGIPAVGFGDIEVIGTCRTYPIRVANRYDENGDQVGWSGPNYDDQREISFEDIGQPVELTTVTKLPRRIFTFSAKQVAEAVHQCGVSKVFLNFANYVKDPNELAGIISSIEKTGAQVAWLGYGPKCKNVLPGELFAGM